MNFETLNQLLQNQPSYRIKQVYMALFHDLITDWSQVTTLPLALRQELNTRCPLEIKAETIASDHSYAAKALLTLADGLHLETVLMRHHDGRRTVCVSSQVGCALGCLFCATGKLGFKRNLTADEIVEQVLFWTRRLKKENTRVTNLVFMGMGEPFLNYDAVMEALKIINQPQGFNIGARHISISTIGVVAGMKKLSQNKRQFNLAVSLHAPNDKLRSQIIPYNKTAPLKILLREINNYIAKTSRRVMIEYLMIDGFNDSPEHALKLADLLKQLDPPLFFVNLIAYNPTDEFKPPPARKIFEFKKILRDNKIDVTERYRFGQDIKAACGQLAGGD